MSPRDWSSRGLVSTHVQLVWSSPVADERYVADRAWERAVLDACPFHPEGGCGVARHGSYPRVLPVGTRVARFLCPVSGTTISLLPRFLAARFSGTLAAVEAVVDAVETSRSLAAAADHLRPADAEHAVTSTSAQRWVRRRMKAVREALLALVTLLPEALGCAPMLRSVRAHLGVQRVLLELRRIGAAHLGALAPPLGLRPRGRR